MPKPAHARQTKTTQVRPIKPTSQLTLYFHSLLLGLAVFAGSYFYTAFHNTPHPLNKAVADASLVLIGLSMLLTSVCYFWDFLDSKIVYRKYLGLVGWAFALVHILLEYSALQRLLSAPNWFAQSLWPVSTGLLAAVIFTVMAAISNRFSAAKLGGKNWKLILRTGYIALLFVLAHVALLKSRYWVSWYNGGMKTLPSMSMLVSIFIVIVVVMRVLLWWSVRRKNA
jgi:DMSO/TMAO reductase YedYZ heme-binding membrane subunit